ncbi:MAG: universal stress protein [Burkholderiales bacterium]
MFNHILVPTDGSPLSHAAARTAVALAKATGAHITAFHVAPEYKFDLNNDTLRHNYLLPGEYAERMAQDSQQYLNDVKKIAEAEGVECSCQYALSDVPAAAIVEAAEKYDCDAIVMGSHGRKGLTKLFLGSQTQKVLVTTNLPVVVTH